uniref:Ig-like domain-containing protein n=1 Tax=Gadus morhua TaxID=8049 RepID=A0A8C5CZQ6_GADMO
MVCDDYRLFVLLLTTSSIVAAVSEETLNVYALLGSNLTLSLDQKLLSYQDTLRWTHNNKVIFSRLSGVVHRGKPTDIDAAGSLQLLNLSDSSAGDYKADVYDRTGKVSTPVVTILCGSSGVTATLKCDVLNRKYVVYAWTHEGQLLTGETKPTLSVSLAKFKGDKGFGCSVSNSASKAQSNTVQLKCKPPPPPLPPPTPKDYCFKASTVMACYPSCFLLNTDVKHQHAYVKSA